MTSTIQEFIQSTSKKYFTKGVNLNEDILDNAAVEKFIKDAQCLILNVSQKNEKILYQTEISKTNHGSLVFFKSSPVSLETEDSLQHLCFIALPADPVESLYLSIRHVYGPLLQADPSMSVDPKIQELLSHLEAGLRAIAQGKDGTPNLTVVLNVDDEVEYWKTLYAESKTRKQKDMAESFLAILQPIAEEVNSLDGNSLEDVKESLESIGGLLDDLWRHGHFEYPQKRMSHLMDVIGNACVLTLQDVLRPLDMWSSVASVGSILLTCCTAVSAWVSACHALTANYWPHHALHAWKGEPHTPQHAADFHERLKQITEIRAIHLQLTKLLSSREQEELKTSKMFLPFTGINLWQCSSSNKQWSKAKAQFERLVKPAEDKIAEKLRPRLTSMSTKQMLHEFGHYASLIERPTVREALRTEREFFLSNLGGLVKEVQAQMGEDRTEGAGFQVPEISPLVQQIQWTKQMMARVSEIQRINGKILIDLPGSGELQNTTEKAHQELQDLETQLYEDWTRDLQMELNKKTLILSPETPVVEFSSENNFMLVNFNPRLVSLERNIRHMSALGFSVPPAVKEAVTHAAQFTEYARELQLIASFHNTQGDRMIVSQRPMMLSAAVRLAALVKEQTAVPWKNIEVVASYVGKLKEAVTNLETQNTYLTEQHNLMRSIVLRLMETDLLQKQNEWKKGVREMRDIVDKVESQGYTNNAAWKTHWEMQLYKALELQYRSALISPLHHLPVTKVQLIYRQQIVQLQPPLEEIRASCHSKLRKLITLPLNFVGLQASSSTFSSIVARNSWLVGGAMLEVEKTLRKLSACVSSWSHWVSLGSADLDALCELHLLQPQDWERNFKECKALGQAIAKLPMEEEQVDWVLLSSGLLRGELESHNRRYWGALTASLQASLHRDTATLENHIQLVTMALRQTVPRTAKELANAQEEYQTLKEKETQMESLLESLRRKQSMVRAWGGERVRSLEQLVRQWEGLQQLMQNHHQLILHQAESVKTSLLGEWSNLESSLEVWWSRWQQNRPRSEGLTADTLTLQTARTAYNTVKGAADMWEEFLLKKEDIISECKKFNMEVEKSPQWEDVEASLGKDLAFWEPFQKFDEELTALTSQEWSLFQKKLHNLDEFTSSWSQRLEPFTPITLFIQNEIARYREVGPSLKHLRGADLTEGHWREIKSLLEIPGDAGDQLKVGDLLAVTDNIKDNAKALQKLWTSASQEAVVRGAVSELELWLAGARLTIVQHKDTHGQLVPIIKDYHETLSKVEEFQSLVGSARAAGAQADQLALWEARLAHLNTCLSGLAHVQRK